MGDLASPRPLRLQGLSLAHGNRTVVRDLTGTFSPGSLTALVGPNGAGKTTLLRAMAGLHAPAGGLIDRGGSKPADIAMLSQGSQLDRQFPLTCLEVVALAFASRFGAFRRIGRSELDRAEGALAAVGLPDQSGHPIGALSAGQFQRVLFARLMVQDASVLLLDEPFTAVDAATEEDLIDIVEAWHAEGRTIVAVLHDLDLVRAAFPRTLLLAGAPIAWGATEAVLTRPNCVRASLVRVRRPRAHLTAA